MLHPVWACEKFSNYVIGKAIFLETNHKPLVPLLARPTSIACHLVSSTFESVSCTLTTPLVTFPESTCPQLTPFHVPLPYPVAITCKESAQTELFVQVITSNLPASADRLREDRAAQEQDNTSSQLIAFCNHGWPNKDQLTGHFYGTGMCEKSFPSIMIYSFVVIVLWCHEAYSRRHCTKSTADNREFYDCHLHVSSAVWWPDIKHKVEQLVRSFPACTQVSLAHRQPMISSPLPNHP